MNVQEGQRILITGGASGLGRALALHFARQGARIALLDLHAQRGQEVLQAIEQAGGTGFFLEGDVREEQTFIDLRRIIEERWGGLDILFNNAGVASHGSMEEAPLADWHWIIDINLLSIVRACRVFIPLMKAQGSGSIVNIASMAGLMHAPEVGSYSATKAAVVAISETLRLELEPSGIRVAVVCPAFFQTNLGESLRSPDPIAPAMVKSLLASSRLSAADIAACIDRGLRAGRFIILPHIAFRFLWWIKRFLPPFYFYLMSKGAQFNLRKKARLAARAQASG